MTEIATYLKGSCLCGEVTYRITEEPETFYFCHCEQCRKVTGSGFAANIITKVDNIEWLSGSELLNHFDHPDGDFSKTFCRLCGSGVPHINKSKTALVIPAGSLDKHRIYRRQPICLWQNRQRGYPLD
ncbi:MAG: GFA family protein [Pseudomonadota bacterium]